MRSVEELEKKYDELKAQVKRDDINKAGKFIINERIRSLEALLWCYQSKKIPDLTLEEQVIILLNQMG